MGYFSGTEILLFEIIITKNIIITKKLIYATLAFPVCELL